MNNVLAVTILRKIPLPPYFQSSISLAFARMPRGLSEQSGDPVSTGPRRGSERRPRRSLGECGCYATAEFRLASPQTRPS